MPPPGLSLSSRQLLISEEKEEEFHVPLFEFTLVKFHDWVAWVNLLFLPEAGINLLGRDLMCDLGIEIKVRKKNFKISLNLMTVQIEDQIFPEVWTGDRNRRGLQILPIHIDPKTPSETTRRKKYPIPMEGTLGLKPIIEGLSKDGLLEPRMSPFNSPILPIRKSDGSYRLVQDLWAINQMVHSKHSVVPNPCTLLSKIPPDHQWFSVVGLKMNSGPARRQRILWPSLPLNGRNLRQGDSNNTDGQSCHRLSLTPLTYLARS
jgi:hypothetical protein